MRIFIARRRPVSREKLGRSRRGATACIFYLRSQSRYKFNQALFTICCHRPCSGRRQLFRSAHRARGETNFRRVDCGPGPQGAQRAWRCRQLQAQALVASKPDPVRGAEAASRCIRRKRVATFSVDSATGNSMGKASQGATSLAMEARCRSETCTLG